MRDIAIFGVGGFGREVLTLIKDINKFQESWNIIGFFDDSHSKGELINGYPTLGTIEDLNNWNNELAVAISIGNPQTKKRIINKINNPLISFPTLIHPSVLLGDTDYIKIGKGCIICAHNIITTNVEIKDFVIVNLACTVGHDSVIGNYSAFMPSVNISGEVCIGDSVYVGTGAKIINQLQIGENSIVGAGAVVIKDVPDNAVVAGVPAKVIKYNKKEMQ